MRCSNKELAGLFEKHYYTFTTRDFQRRVG